MTHILDNEYRSVRNILSTTTALRAPSVARRGLRGAVALLAGALMAAQPAQAQSIFGFETGNLTGWTIGGSAVVLGSDSTTFGTGSVFEIGAHQNYMAKIKPGDYVTIAEAEGLLGLDNGSFFATGVAAFLNASNFGLITRSLLFDAGTYSFAWSYAAQDYDPYDDGVFFSIAGGGTSEIRVLAGNVTGQADSIIVGSYGSTPWRVASFTIAEAGIYKIGFGAYNWDDEENAPTLYIDSAPGSLSEDGEDVPPDVPSTTPTINTAQSSYTAAELVDGTVLPVFDGGTLRIDTAGTYSQALTINAAGGTVDTDGQATTLSGVISGDGALTKAGAGTLTLSGTNTYTGKTTVNAGTLSVVSDANLGAGALTLAAGATLAVTGTTTIDNAVTLSGTATIDTSADITATLSGAIGGAGGLVKTGAGTLKLSGGNGYLGSTTIEGGTLSVRNYLNLGTGDITMGEGTTLAITGPGGFGHAINIAGSATIDTAEGVSIGLDGALVGTAALTKTGEGWITLTADSSAYTGAISVNEGWLTVTGKVGGAVNMADGTTLRGHGTIAGTVTVADGGRLLVGRDIGTLTVGSVVLGDDALIEYELDTAGVVGGGVNDLLVVTGDVTLGGVLNIVNAGDFGAGVYRLINYGGTLVDNGMSFGMVPGDNATRLSVQTSVNGEVNLVNATGHALNFWDGAGAANDGIVSGGAGVWSAAGGNWTDSDGALNASSDAGLLVFQGTGGTVTVSGPVGFTGLQFAADGYSVRGDALTLDTPTAIRVGEGTVAGAAYVATIASNLTGEGSLIKTDLGTLILTGTNSYTGGTTVSAGTLIGNTDSIRGAIANAGTVVFNQATDARFDGAITGTGLTVKQGTGTLTLAGLNQQDWRIDQGGLAGSAGSFGGDIAIGANGALAFNDASDAAFAGALLGTGSLTKLGAGTLTLSGDSSGYTGTTTVAAGGVLLTGALASDVTINAGGTFQVGNGGASGDLTGATINNGTLIFARSNDYNYSGALSGNGALIKQGEGLLLLSGSYNYTGSTVVQGGSVQLAAALNPRTDLVMGAGTFDLDGRDQAVAGLSGAGGTLQFGGGSLTVSQGVNGTFGGSLTGAGRFIKDGAGTLNLTGDSSFTGQTLVNGGRLAVNGALASVVTVNSGGTVGGNGILGGLIVRSGGTAAPGNSLGTIHVAGNVTFEAGSLYNFEVNGLGESDHIVATGTATLQGGTVAVLAANGGTYQPFTRYTILTAAGAVTGQFANVTSDLAFLSPSLSYDATNVYLTLARNDIDFASVATTANQRASANAAETLGVGNGLYQQIAQLTATDAANAFDQLSGEVHASARAAMIDDARLPRFAVLGRLSQASQAGNGAWMQGFGSWSESNGNGNAARADRSTTGMIMGLDTAAGSHWRFGLAGGYTHADIDVAARGGDAKAESTHVLGYAGAAYGPLRIKAGVGYAHVELDMDRTVAFAGFTDTLGARYEGSLVQGFGEVSVAAPIAGGTVEPFAGVSVVRARTSAFAETGGAAALTGARRTDTTEWSTVGVRVATPSSGPVFARASSAWQRRFGDGGARADLAFSGGSAFRVSGNALSRDSLIAETEIGWRLSPSLVLHASYAGTIGDRTEDHAVKGAITFAF